MIPVGCIIAGVIYNQQRIAEEAEREREKKLRQQKEKRKIKIEEDVKHLRRSGF